eukprot:CAMPEP_0184211358 /NCGR_PEP_ID=MMETSP0976-20121227/13089_1 /TAXON_ID=483370 /ORGANISM="non described non described, Strain CCMP2097" /LENGTH=1054 /DNA_ID=CAMNT_0026516061 /DNA_START=102 /DNA_END=3263 /DNA_ORIENTATION=+
MWEERAKGPLKDREAVAENARLDRERRAALRERQKPASKIAAVWRASRVRCRGRAAAVESVLKKAEDIEKVRGFVAATGGAFAAPESVATPLIRELCFGVYGLGRRAGAVSREHAEFAAKVCCCVVVGNFETVTKGPGATHRLARLVDLCWRSVLVVDSEAERFALETCILGLTEDDGSESRRGVAAKLRTSCASLWCADLGRACRNRRASSTKVDAGLSVLFGVGAQRCQTPADFVLDVLSVPLLAAVVDAAVLKQLCASSLLREGLASVAGAAPQFAQGEDDLDSASWLLGNLGALAPKLALGGDLALNFAVVCAKLVEESTCVSALLGDAETAVVKWALKAGAQTPIVAPTQLRIHVAALLDNRAVLQHLAKALLAQIHDDDALDVPTSADLALDASLAMLNADALNENSAKAKRTFMTDVLGAKWARKIDAAGKSFGAMFSAPERAAEARPRPAKPKPSDASPKPTARPRVQRDAALRDASAFCGYLFALLAHAGPKRRDAALTSISFQDFALQRGLWTLVLHRGEANAAAALTKYLGSEDANRDAIVDVVIAFAATLQHALICVDDDELRATSRPLATHQLRKVVPALKDALYAWCASKARPDDLLRVFGAKCLANLLRDLHARSIRRPFARPELWVVDAADSVSATKSLTRALASDGSPSRLLRVAPYAVPFRERARIFADAVGSVSNAQAERMSMFDAAAAPKTLIRVRRGREIEDGLSQLAELPAAQLRGRLVIAFEGEVGIDAGGLFKEFWTELSKGAFSASYGLFKTTDGGLLYPNPDAQWLHGDGALRLFRFVGRVVGKALREGITIQPRFARFFLSAIRGDYNYLDLFQDLKTLDGELYRNLRFLRAYAGDVADLGLTFSQTHDRFGKVVEVDLIPGGASVDVTRQNRLLYMQLVAKHHLVDRVAPQAKAFVQGLGDAVQIGLLTMFSEPELQLLVSGAEAALDVDDLEAHTRCEGFRPGDGHVARFWAVVRSLSPSERALLLQFATSCERAPPLGFAALQPPFTLRKVTILRDADRLPTASTCFNTLKLPTYSSQAVLRQR